MAAVDRLRVVIENNPNVPGEARILCPHIGKWIQTDRAGIALLPAPFANVEIIEIEPLNSALYGPKFKNFFPVHDGVISLRAIPVTTALLVKVEHYKATDDLDKGAMASALVATRSGFVAKETSLKYQRTAFELLGKKYRVPIPYVADRNSLRGSPELANAVNAKLGKQTVPTDQVWTLADFRKASEVKDYEPIVGASQKKLFAAIKKSGQTTID